VFFDFFLFENLRGLENSDLDGRAKAYLEKPHLDRKERVRDGVFSTAALSQGKAVAVITRDDKYFHLADRLIKLDYGKVRVTGNPSPVSGSGTPPAPPDDVLSLASRAEAEPLLTTPSLAAVHR
jgi:putative ATP-binding cassette transporter